MFSELQQLPADPILGLSALFQADENTQKVDLGVGVYKDNDGTTPIIKAVRDAYRFLAQNENSKSYVSPMGWPGFTDACLGLTLGNDLADDLSGRISAIQTPGGCGALRLGFDLIASANANTTVWVSDPTWANHVPIITAAGLVSREYPYYCKKTGTVDVEAMLDGLVAAKPGDVVLLHACCHNPTGADIPADAWPKIVETLVERGLFPFVDMAYQGFAAGIEEDAHPLQTIFAEAPEALLSYSCSKNFGLYRERTGALIAKGKAVGAAGALGTNLAKIARQSYSMPPAHGAALVATIMQDADLTQSWMQELEAMRQRILSLRNGLAKALEQKGQGQRFGNVAAQTGMFSLLNLSPEQVGMLQKEHSIYFPGNGRINVAGLTEANIPYVADCLIAVGD